MAGRPNRKQRMLQSLISPPAVGDVDPSGIEWSPRFSRRQSMAYRLLERPEVTELLFGGAKGGGKAAALDTPIVTVGGWRTMGTIRVGDVVFDESGAQCSVTAISPVYKRHQCYRLRFSDKSEIVADAEHLWATDTHLRRCNNARRTEEFRAKRRAARPRRGTDKRPDLARANAAREYEYKAASGPDVVTTEDIAGSLFHNEFANHSISICCPLQYLPAEVPIPPYVLGCWLGDGSSRSGQFTTNDAQIIDEIRKDGFIVEKNKAKYQWHIHGLLVKLRESELLRDKHIPEVYRRASIEQRLAMLQGLVDTDGHVDERGAIEISLSDERLAGDAWELVVGLGIKAVIRQGASSLNGERHKDRYRIKFKTHLPACRLARKAARQDRNPSDRVYRRYIIGCEKVESVPVRCISVDSPSHLYLIGRSLIPTHNTVFGCYQCFMWAINIIHEYRIPPRKFPIPVGFMGRKQGTDFRDTTLETWKRFIPDQAYSIKEQSKEIIVGGAVKIEFGGLDDSDKVRKFNSAEYAFFFIDQAEEVTLDDIAELRGSGRLVLEPNKGIIPRKGLFTANPRQCWLKSEFIENPAPHQRFVQSLPADNPWLGPGYIETLQQSFRHRPELLAAYLEGLWDAFEGDEQVIREKWVREAALRRIYGDGRELIVCDPARFGNNETVIYHLVGTEIAHQLIYGQRAATYTANRLMVAQKDYGCPIVVDCDGIGGPIVDRLREMGAVVIDFQGSKAATDKDRYYNRRAEAWSEVAQMFADGEVQLRHDDRQLASQLSVPQYKFHNGRVLIEGKDEIAKRLGRLPGSSSSPDRADAYVMGLSSLKLVQPMAKAPKQEGGWWHQRTRHNPMAM